MPACFETGSDDGIHTSLLKCGTLFGCCGRTDRDDIFRTAFVQDFSWRNSKDETEHGYVFIQQYANLILKSRRRIRFVSWTRYSQRCQMTGKRRKAPVERAFIRCSRPGVLHRYPQIHCERFRGKRADFSYHIFDCPWGQTERAKRSESAKV